MGKGCKSIEKSRSREVWVDWMRVAACFMVMIVHSTEPFYLGGDGSLILTKTNAFWSAFFDSFVRACVPLFVVASSYLQFPLHYSTKDFFRKRAVRILVPFVFWSIVYAIVFGDPAGNLKSLALNFNYSAGHLWFVYMLVGLYLLMPILSPWAEKVGKKELQIYLGIWLFTSLIPLIRDWVSPSSLLMIYGPTGIPRQALFPLWGEASWNAYGTFYYFSGFIGYLLLGLYLRRFIGELSWKKTTAIGAPLWIAGFTITFGGFLHRVTQSSNGIFPVGGPVDLAVRWETTWCYDSIGVVLMTIGWLLLFKKLRSDGKFYSKILLPVSKASYEIYLIHMLILVPVSGFIIKSLGSAADGVLGFWTTPIEIILTATATFICAATVSLLLHKIRQILEQKVCRE